MHNRDGGPLPRLSVTPKGCSSASAPVRRAANLERARAWSPADPDRPRLLDLACAETRRSNVLVGSEGRSLKRSHQCERRDPVHIMWESGVWE